MQVYGKERDYVVHDKDNIKGFFGQYRFLSNFHTCEIHFDGLIYSSTEAAYQSAKTKDFEKRKEFTILVPNKSMKKGRELEKTSYFRKDWKEVKFDVMSAVIFDKFYRHPKLREALLDTGNKCLEETNHWGDRYWGVCDGTGESNLGKILMAVREYWKLDKNYGKQTKIIFESHE